MQLTTPIICPHVNVHVMASRFCLEAMVRGYCFCHFCCFCCFFPICQHGKCLLQRMGSFSKQDSTGSEGSSAFFFGKVPHSSFALCDQVCINTKDPTLVIITPLHSFRGKNFGKPKFGDQASICQIRQNLLPPIFSAIQ